MLCYLWENSGPHGAQGMADGNATHRYVILRSGEEDRLDFWYAERRDVAADFLQAFGRLPDKDAVLSITIDTNDTDSEAEAFYRDIRLYIPNSQLPPTGRYSTNR